MLRNESMNMYERRTKLKEMKNCGSTTYWSTTMQAIPYLCFIAFRSRRVAMISVIYSRTPIMYTMRIKLIHRQSRLSYNSVLLLVAIGARRMEKSKTVCVFQWDRYGWLCVCVRAQRKMKLSCLPRFEGKKNNAAAAAAEIGSRHIFWDSWKNWNEFTLSAFFANTCNITRTITHNLIDGSAVQLMSRWITSSTLFIKCCSPWLDDSLPDVMKSQVPYGNGTSAAKISLKVCFFVVYSNTVRLIEECVCLILRGRCIGSSADGIAVSKSFSVEHFILLTKQ